MGASKSDYERAAPYHSFIHVNDFKGPKQLAQYLHLLDKNATMYNEYFKWKGTGELIDHNLKCRVCVMLNYPKLERKHYKDFNKWWMKEDICEKRVENQFFSTF